jgi:hypothetical protein
VITTTNTLPIATTAIPDGPSQMPSLTSILGVETYAYISTSIAYLYKGPALTYEYVVPKAYPKGEKFTVLSRNANGLWLLCKAADGNEGWLYLYWLKAAISPTVTVIPTASFIPILPPPISTKPGGEGGATPPQATCDSSSTFC